MSDVKRASEEQLHLLQAKQLVVERARRDAQLAIDRAKLAERDYANAVADVLEDCGVDPTVEWQIEDDGSLTRAQDE